VTSIKAVDFAAQIENSPQIQTDRRLIL